MNLKLLLVDDHAMLRRGLRETLSRQPSLTLVGEAWSGAMALQLANELTPDLVLLDIHLPDMNGIEVSRQILKAHPGMKIVIFSSDAARSLVDEALQAGVCGYLLKTSSGEELMLAINSVTAGNLYLSPEINGNILKDYRKGLLGEKQDAKPLLSDRDKQLLRLIAEGHRNKEISAELDVGIKSVEAYRSRLMKKLSCSSSAELIRYAVREGIAKL